MSHRVLINTSWVSFFFLAGITFGQASFQGLGDLPGGDFSSIALDVSADGRVVVGVSRVNANENEAFRWQDGVMLPVTGLGVERVAQAVSADGSVIVGRVQFANGESDGFRWEDGTMISLGFQSPEDVSADGSIIVGNQFTDSSQRLAIVWDGGVLSELTGLGGCSGAGGYNYLYAVSPDGTSIAGASQTSKPGACPTTATTWHDGNPVGLGSLTDGKGTAVVSYAYGISSDGSVLVGNSVDPLANRQNEVAIVWRNGVLTALDKVGALPGEIHSTAKDVSADGRVVVGYKYYSGNQDDATVWFGDSGPQRIRFQLELHGLDLSGWQLERAHAVSADGRTIVGYGTNPDGQREGWIAVLPSFVDIPTVSDVGMAVMLLGFLVAGGYIVARRHRQDAKS